MSHRHLAAVFPPRRARNPMFAVLALLALAACDNDDDDAPPPVAPEPPFTGSDVLPGVVVTIDGVRGFTGPGGRARAGDRLTVDFTAITNDGSPLELTTMARGAIMISGPTFNYQRVIEPQSDVLTASVKRDVGKFSYTFALPIPSVYLAPINDTDSSSEGELTGQTLLSGTYTIGLELRKDYVLDGETLRDPGNTTFDFLFGDATAIQKREVVTLANCNQCHTEVRAHGDNRNNVANCILCHTTGSEDGNNPAVAGGTPGTSIDFKVMIHKIHAGSRLPSVLGVTTNPDGTRKYDAPKQPYVVLGRNDSVNDFSTVTWPNWPSFFTPMPRDSGHTSLTSTQQSLEDSMRRGPVECSKCHGDPDGTGPLPAPAQGDLIYAQPTIGACGSCHDDWVPEHLYTANTQTMPIQSDSAACKNCHRESGTPLDVVDAHRHPLVDPSIAVGLVFDVTSVTDVGGTPNGRFEPGERIEITFQAKDGAGNPVAANTLSRIEPILSGPTTNPQLINYVRAAPAFFPGIGPHTFRMPEVLWHEPIGISTGANGEVFTTTRAPHWNVSGATTSLLRVTGLGNASTLAAPAKVTDNYVDVAPGTGSLFADDNYVLIDGFAVGVREYMRVQYVEGDRLWFGSTFRSDYKPNLRIAHAAGASIAVATTVAVPTTSYTVAAATGTVTETVEFGVGEVICTYTSDFVIPAVYPGALEDTPVHGENWGDWTGLPLLDGTYTFDMHGSRALSVVRFGATTSYTEGADSTVRKLLFGAATEVTDVTRIDPQACYGCHESLQFHGGSRRSVEACLQCHGNAGTENSPPYIDPSGSYGNAAEFRHMLHKKHIGVFPAMPGGVQDCAKCHGENTAWTLPAERLHPQQTTFTRSWYVACSSCHDSTSAVAHMDVNTSTNGAESCATCHGEGDPLDVRTVHKIR
jgi:hypothetical protein